MSSQMQPVLLYKQQNIAYARANFERYSWAREIVAGWRSATAYARRQERAFFEAFIPELTPGTYYGQNCPHCVGEKSLMGGGAFKWTVETPEQLSCQYCGTVYPHADYPETGVLDCPRMGQTFTYYQTPEERAEPQKRNDYAFCWLGDRPAMTSFSGHSRCLKVDWAWRQSLVLAKLYALTGELDCAVRAGWILERFARVFPRYLFHSYDGSVADWPPLDVAANMGAHESSGGPRGGRFPREVVRHAYDLNTYEDHSELYNGFWGAGRINVHGKGSDAGPIFDMAVAFDLIRGAQYPDGTRVVDAAAEYRIINDLLVAGCTEMEHWVSLSNKGTAVYALSAAIGILCRQPERVRRAFDMFEQMLRERYHHDGFFSESPAYSAHNFGNVHELADLLHGYSDPAGYRDAGGERLDEVDFIAAGRYHLSLLSLMRMLAPGPRLPVIGDTAYQARPNVLCAEVLAARLGGDFAAMLETLQGASLAAQGSEYALWYRPPELQSAGAAPLPLRSEWFPGWHVAVLRGGRAAANDTALYLNGNEHDWTLHSAHRQADILSMSYYAYGEELVSDRGYFSGSGQLLPDGRSGQQWVSSTLSHNLVVVDEEDQRRRECGSNLELFGLAPGIEVVQAAAVNAYPQCEDYRRTCAMIRGPQGSGYVVDFFRVRGGRVHQYAFHCEGTLADMDPEGPQPQPTTLSAAWSKWVEKPAALQAAAPTFSWRHGEVGLDLTMLSACDRILLVEAPGWRVANPPAELDKAPLQQILAERRSADSSCPAASQFAAVMAPYKERGTPIVEAHLLADDPDAGVVAIEVRLEGRRDYIISTRDQQERTFGPVEVAGEFAFVSLDEAGRPVQAYLLKGTRCRCGPLEIEMPQPQQQVKVRAVRDRTFYLAAPLHPLPAAGSQLLVGDKARTGFEIETASADSIQVRDYPAIECAEATILYARWVGEE